MPLIHHGICAWITSNNVNLLEHSVTADYETNTVSCFVAGVAGQKFTVWWTNLDGSAGICTFITLDGCRVPGKILYGVGTACRSGARVTGNAQRPFVFKDQIEGLSSTDISPDAGIITLKVKRVRLEAPAPVKDSRHLPSDALLGKRKAIGGFHVGFGEEEPTEPRLPLTWKLAPAEYDAHSGSPPKTFVTFIFRYRSQEHLNSMTMTPSETPVAQSAEATEAHDAPARKKQKLRHSSTFITSSYTSPDQTQGIDPPQIPLRSGTVATANISDVPTPDNLTPGVSSHVPITSIFSQQQSGVDSYLSQSGGGEATPSFPTGSGKDMPLPFDSAIISHRVHQEMLTSLPPNYREDPSYARFVELYHAPAESSSSQIQASTSCKSSRTTARKASKSRAVSATNPPATVSQSQPESKRASSWTGQPSFDSHPKAPCNFQGFNRDDSNTPPSA
ncbi:hypothetical protein BJ912DRAFT_945663 [Pholiota molesta]|nr:hypothetical protein BJ912DRAFT_945663 [Pholiota molesta]